MARPMVFAVLASMLAILTPAASAETFRYIPRKSELKYLFAVADPVLRIRPGDIVESEAVDQEENVKDPKNGWKPLSPNPETGPFYVEGAEPGDTLAVTILDLEVASDVGVGETFPGFGILNSSQYTPMLGSAVPARSWFYPIDKERGLAEFHAKDSDFVVKIPLSPFLGCLGVAPADGEARSRRASGAAIWTRRRFAKARPSIFRSTSKGRCSISETATLPRARERLPALLSKWE